MEFAALSGLIAIGVAVSQLASTTPQKNKEGFLHTLGLGILPQNKPPSDPALPNPTEFYTIGLQQYLTKEEASNITDLNSRINYMAGNGNTSGVEAIKAQIQTIVDRATTRRAQAGGEPSKKAASITAMAGVELDMMYKTPGGQTYPSEPNAGPRYGTALTYATGMPPLRNPNVAQGPDGFVGQGPIPEPIESSRPQVQLSSSGVEAFSTWVKGDSVVSALSGQSIDSADFKHNNMQPYFGGRVKQNMTSAANTSKLDTFTGAGSTQIKKQEIAPMFNYNQPFGQPFGNKPNADFVRSRIVEPGRRNNEKPFEPTRVGPSLGEKGGITGNGGFQQIEVNEIMKRAMPTTDKLRVATNPKLSYNNQVVPGAHFIGNAALDSGEVRKYRPDTFFLNETGERNGVATGEVTKEMVRPTQV
jgi:hypothetical protein